MTPDSPVGAVILGIVQGITEWIPVSSDGAVTATYTYLFKRPVAEAVRYAFWLHLGTALAATWYFRREIIALLRQFFARRGRLTPKMWFLLVATVVGGVVALPFLIALDEISTLVGGAAMALVGVFLIVTGLIQIPRRRAGTRTREQVTTMDATLTGVAQGLSILPGLSRSAGTIGVLLARKVDAKEAMVLSFILSIPATLAAAVWAGADSGLYLSRNAVIGVAVAAVVGLATLKLLLAAAERINFGKFVLIAGIAIVGAAVWEILR